MAKRKTILSNQQQGIILLIAVALICAPLPSWLPWEKFGTLIVLLMAIYNLFR
jgi:hypothetical protein